MSGDLAELRALGNEVARLLGPADAATLDRVRARAVAGRGSALLRAKARVRRGPAVAAAAAFVTTALALALVRASSPSALSASVDDGVAREALAAGAWVSAEERAVPVTFSDGTRFELARGGQARLVAVGPRGANVTLERGHLHGVVVRRDGARWRIDAGPFVVAVTGTELDVDWNPEEATLRVKLKTGSALVRGCHIAVDRAVVGGEELRAECTHDSAARNARPQPPLPVPPSASGPPVPAPSLAAPPPASVARAGGEDWRELARGRRYDEAVRLAEAEGLGSVCARASGEDLDALSDAARLAHRGDVAGRVLDCARTRFPGTERAATAAFELGRVASTAGDDARAQRWFEVYLQERPSGHLAREALGRAMESAERVGARDRATELAQRYLRNYPTGPHAGAARVIVDASGGTP